MKIKTKQMDEIILGKLNRIEAKLDAVIKALHEYDDANIEDINEGYGESSFESFMDSKDDILNWKVDGTERRIHHVTNEEADEDAATFNDYGMRVVKDNDNDTQDKHVVGDKDKRTGGNKKKYKGKRKFTQDLIPKNK
jgi:hypothetical protein